jgi:parallel beta-helix repeat protein
MYVYFGGATPSSYTVKASNTDANITITGSTKAYADIVNLKLEGGNTRGIYLINAQHIKITNCDIEPQGGDGVYGGDAGYIDIAGTTFRNCLNNGVFYEYGADLNTVINCTFDNIAMIGGASKSGDAAMEGIIVLGNSTTIRGNTVTNIGYNGIAFNGDTVLIENNLVNNHCAVKDDGGGIYTVGNGSTGHARTIQHNIILNGSTASFSGVSGDAFAQFSKAAGIYIDDFSSGVDILNNTVVHNGWGGIFLHNSSNINVKYNIAYDNAYQFFTDESSNGNNRTITNIGNQWVSKLTTQPAYFSHLFGNESNTLIFTTTDSNYYARPLDQGQVVEINNEAISDNSYAYNTWPGHDTHGHPSPLTFGSLSDNISFLYNATASPVTSSLGGLTMIDIKGTAYNNNIVTIPAYSSVILLKTGVVAPTTNYLILKGIIIKNH